MATDVITIWNMALSAASGKATVSAVDEVGREAKLCRLWWDTVRRNVLKAASWPCTKQHASLAVLAERDFTATWVNGDPPPPWKYAYSVPVDMLAPRFLTTYAPFERSILDDKNVLLTDQSQAILEYTKDQENVELWDAGLVTAVVYSLASHIAIPLTGKASIASRNYELAYKHVMDAQTEIANEADEMEEMGAPWHEVRGYEQLVLPTRYVYPYASLAAPTIA